MWGAIIGDIIGSTFENENHRSQFFELFPKQSRFTDDTVTSLSIVDSLFKYYSKNNTKQEQEKMKILISDNLRLWSCCYFQRGFGSLMQQWITSGINYAYNSPGKASLTRLSSLPLYAINYKLSKNEMLNLAEIITTLTHKNDQAVNTSKAYTSILYDLLNFKIINNNNINKEDTMVIVLSNLKEYNIPRPKMIEQYRVDFTFNLNSEHVLSVAIAAIIEANSFEEAIRLGVSAGGCTDTICSLVGAMAEVIFGISEDNRNKALGYFNNFDKNMLSLLNKLYLKEDGMVIEG